MGHKLISNGLRAAGAMLLGGVILWQVADRAVPHRGETIIHVTVADADVFLDDDHYQIHDQADSPIVRQIKPGWHVLRMMKYGKVLYDRPFEILRGDDGIILTAWNQLCPDAPEKGNSPLRVNPRAIVQSN
jgi:hypothetical protein